MKIVEIKQISDNILEAMNYLVPQLSPSSSLISADDLEDIIRDEGTILFLAEESGFFIGTLTLVIFRIPTGIRARIEDLVVAEAARGKGAGKQLVNHALRVAFENGATGVDLTSHASRVVANEMYKRLGFETRTTNVYRCVF
ncbi:GNAT family N-acetyltransferase [Pleomorphomonas sp. JP5]|uniref:GNAT family N-acetyltransferase n=1 Tax=Pleomorphomonas sp. JP5 TaxID=2942998 RepID=UPI0020440568|nr:GNAT family N-acetyltransferase [Pleomorphomonas sp. JP5]MCM5557444.1 GNAT family N-acetyltransferase [Pleomorphomonas sp. JP5]